MVKLLHTFKFALATPMRALSSSPTFQANDSLKTRGNHTLSGKLVTVNSAPADGHL